MIWTNPIDLDALNKFSKGSLSDLLEIEYVEAGDDFLIAKMPVEKKHMQPMGSMHGGASCVLAETLGSMAANLCVDQKLKKCVGLEINVNHLRPVTKGILKATAKPFHIGRTTQVWEIKIENEENKLIAISRHTVAVIHGPI